MFYPVFLVLVFWQFILLYFSLLLMDMTIRQLTNLTRVEEILSWLLFGSSVVSRAIYSFFLKFLSNFSGFHKYS